jgi:hypothetical protein
MEFEHPMVELFKESTWINEQKTRHIGYPGIFDDIKKETPIEKNMWVGTKQQ